MLGLTRRGQRLELDRFRGQMDNIIGRLFRGVPFTRLMDAGDWMPVVDVSETEKEIIVQAEVPGMADKDIVILINGRVLTLKGEKKSEQKEEGKNFHRIERRYGSCSRTFNLPADVDDKKIQTNYKDGVLTINLPKSKEQSDPIIEVKAS